MNKLLNKIIEAVVYYIIMYILVTVMINERYRGALYKMSAFAILAATLVAIIKLMLGGEEGLFSEALNKMSLLIFLIYAATFAGCLMFDSFAQLITQIFG